MKPVETADCNFTYRLDGGTAENNLPCLRGAGFVTSFWDADPSEIQKIVLDGRVVIWVWWPNMVGVKVGLTDALGRNGADLARGTPTKAEPFATADGRAWFYEFELNDDERTTLRNGGKVKLTVDSTPPPPVSVTPYEE